MSNENNLSSKFEKLNLIEFSRKNNPINNIEIFHLFFSNLNFVLKKQIYPEIKKNIPLIGKAVAKKNAPKLKKTWPNCFTLILRNLKLFFSTKFLIFKKSCQQHLQTNIN